MSHSDLLAALIAFNPRNYVPIDKVTIPHFDPPEKSMYRSELLNNLSKDASFVIRLVLDTPDDLKDILLKTNGEVQRTTLMDILDIQGWKPARRKAALQEVRTFTREYYGS